MKPEKRVTDAVEKAQDILADYVEPGARNCENTINQLMDVLDDTQLIEAVDEVKNGRSEEERAAGPQQDQHAVSKEKLQKAVDKVGNSAAAVRKELAA